MKTKSASMHFLFVCRSLKQWEAKNGRLPVSERQGKIRTTLIAVTYKYVRIVLIGKEYFVTPIAPISLIEALFAKGKSLGARPIPTGTDM